MEEPFCSIVSFSLVVLPECSSLFPEFSCQFPEKLGLLFCAAAANAKSPMKQAQLAPV
jgi:hypothetical protein